jgi:hypothetical protein
LNENRKKIKRSMHIGRNKKTTKTSYQENISEYQNIHRSSRSRFFVYNLLLFGWGGRHFWLGLEEPHLGGIETVCFEVFAELLWGMDERGNGGMRESKRTSRSSAAIPSWLRGLMKKNVMSALRIARPVAINKIHKMDYGERGRRTATDPERSRVPRIRRVTPEIVNDQRERYGVTR